MDQAAAAGRLLSESELIQQAPETLQPECCKARERYDPWKH